MSSANRRASLYTFETMSFMNSAGPSLDPWGIPDATSLGDHLIHPLQPFENGQIKMTLANLTSFLLLHKGPTCTTVCTTLSNVFEKFSMAISTCGL